MDFESKVIFTEDQIEMMITDLRDILGRLREKSVLDYSKGEKSIRLLDSKNTLIEFSVTEFTEVKRFIALVKSTLSLIAYLVRNPTSMTVITQVERQDRIMGAVNIQKTFLVNTRNLLKSKKVVCNEIHKSSDSPENLILVMILLSIIFYCDRYLSTTGYLKSGARLGNPDLNDLRSIRKYGISLLSSKSMKSCLPLAIDRMYNFDILLRDMTNRVNLGKVPKYFAGIYQLLYRWKYFVWVSSKEYDKIENTLRYHFFGLKKYDQLYECWIFYKILELVTHVYDSTLKETPQSKGVATFRTNNNNLKITYQPSYKTGWMDGDVPVQDRPDMVLEFNNSNMIIDAKNSTLPAGKTYPYRRQIDSYIASVGTDRTDYGILVFSSAMEENWKEIIRHDQKILWIGLTPSFEAKSKSANDKAIEKITEIINQSRLK